jgi:hypothetical protein
MSWVVLVTTVVSMVDYVGENGAAAEVHVILLATPNALAFGGVNLAVGLSWPKVDSTDWPRLPHDCLPKAAMVLATKGLSGSPAPRR